LFALAVPREDTVAELVLGDVEIFFVSFSIACAVVNSIHHFVLAYVQRIRSKNRSPASIEPDDLFRIFRHQLHFLINIEDEALFIVRRATVLLPLNVKISTGSFPLRRLEQGDSVGAADASSPPVGKLPSVDRGGEEEGDGFWLIRQKADDPVDVLFGRDDSRGFQRGAMGNVLIEIFSKIFHFLLSVIQDGRKFLFSSDHIKIIQKS
jgi:hypothetical protein